MDLRNCLVDCRQSRLYHALFYDCKRKLRKLQREEFVLLKAVRRECRLVIEREDRAWLAGIPRGQDIQDLRAETVVCNIEFSKDPVEACKMRSYRRSDKDFYDNKIILAPLTGDCKRVTKKVTGFMGFSVGKTHEAGKPQKAISRYQIRCASCVCWACQHWSLVIPQL